MANSLYQQLNSNSMAAMMETIRRSPNPQAALMEMASSNSRVAQVLNEVRANGGDARSLFYRKAQQMGVNPDSVLGMLRK